MTHVQKHKALTQVGAYLLFSLLILLLIPTANAQQTYKTLGVTRDNSYQQDGSGVWANRTPVTSTRAYSKVQSYTPLVSDFDNDTANEIAIIADDNLEFLNFTTGIGLISEFSVSHGNTSISTQDYQLTPASFDYDSDGLDEIVSWNGTHFLTFGWNGTAFTLEQSVATGLSQTVPSEPVNIYPVIKCAQGNQWASGNDTCITILNNRSAVTTASACAYDVNANTVVCTAILNIPNDDANFHNTHLADGNSDGFLEAYWAYEDPPNGDMQVFVIEVDTTNTVTTSEVYDHQLNNNFQFSDISVSNIDGNAGNGLEITWFYQAGAQPEYEAISIRTDGTLIDDTYFTNNPEGNMLSSNSVYLLTQGSNIFTAFSSTSFPSNCIYIRSYDNTDKYACVSQYTGSSSGITEFTAVSNFTREPMIHQGLFANGASVLTPRTLVTSNGAQTSPLFLETDNIIPVDFSITGTIDFIGLNASRIVYYDDAYTNQNVVISSLTVGTGNPACQFVTQRFTPVVTDAENDVTVCFVEERLLNGTRVRNSTNQSFTPPGSPQMTLFLNVTGSFEHVVHCRDQFHDAFVTQTRLTTVSNDTNTCRQQDVAPVTQEFLSSNATQGDAEFLTGIDNVLGNYNVTSQRAKNVIWLFIMVVVGIGSAIVLGRSGLEGGMSFFTVLIVEMGVMLMGFYMGFISTIVLVMVGMLLAVILTILLAARMVNQGG